MKSKVKLCGISGRREKITSWDINVLEWNTKEWRLYFSRETFFHYS